MVKRTQYVKGKIPNFLAFSLPGWFHPYILNILVPKIWKPLIKEIINYIILQLDWLLHMLIIIGPDIWKPLLKEIITL